MKFSNTLVLLVANSLALVGCGARSTDEEQVRELFTSAEAAAEDRDASDVLTFIADDYADAQGLDKTQLGQFLRGYLLAHPKLELLVTIESLEFPGEGVAQAVVTVTALELADPQRERIAVELRRRHGEWRVVRADRARS
jgi:hypothetical protein